MTNNDRYEGSARQRKQRQRTKIVAIVMAAVLLLPIIMFTWSSIRR